MVSSLGALFSKPKAPVRDTSIQDAQAKQQLKLDAQEGEQRKQKTSLASLATGASGRSRQTLGRGGKTGIQTKLGTPS